MPVAWGVMEIVRLGDAGMSVILDSRQKGTRIENDTHFSNNPSSCAEGKLRIVAAGV